MHITRLLAALLVVAIGAGCTSAPASPTPSPSPPAACAEMDMFVEGRIECGDAVDRALAALRQLVPEQMAKGVAGIEVRLGNCPVGEIPPQIQCVDPARQLYFVTVRFGPPGPGQPMDESLTVGLDATSGRVMGISNPLIR
jgi:hypothetical protein